MELTHEQLETLTRSPLWAIRSDYADYAVLSLLQKPSADSPRWEAEMPSFKPGQKSQKIAVIPIQGVLTKNGPRWVGSNYDTIGKAVEQAKNDPEVSHVVLAVDSPGGQVTGLPETAAAIAELAKVKPVTAMVEGMSASAAYFLASQAKDIVLTPSGEVGSVGVRMMHADISKMLESNGITVTEMHSGDFKTEWSPFKPLSEDAKAHMQPRLEALHNEFIQAVTDGRGTRATNDAKDQRFGEGRMFSANEAKRLGLIDQVQSASEFYRGITPAAEPETPRFGLQDHKRKFALERGRFSKAV